MSDIDGLPRIPTLEKELQPKLRFMQEFVSRLLSKIASPPRDKPDPIDAIVTWVDGSDPAHASKRAHFFSSSKPNNRKAFTERRFSDNGEVRLCLRSLHNYAPWLRNIWLVTDGQVPAWMDLQAADKLGIRIVDHKAIFRGYEHLLPTFNSLAIESMMWRIDGLSEKFIYLNDDMFLTRPVSPSDFFDNNRAVVRGTINDHTGKPINFYRRGITNAEEMLGMPISSHLSSAHVVYPMLRSVLIELFERFEPELFKNAAYRFRTSKQFQLLALHDRFALSTDRAVLKGGKDTVHFPIRFCRNATAREIRRRLDALKQPTILAGCVNYAEAILPKVPDIFERLSAIAGPPAPFENV